MAKQRATKTNPVAGFIFITVILVAGLLCGTQSTLSLRRDSTGAVTAVNEWRLIGEITLISRTVTHLREAKIAEIELSERERRAVSSRDVFGMMQRREELLLIGDNQMSYPYKEDLSLIRSFIANPANKEAVSYYPVDIRRSVASWFLLGFACACIVGWLVKLMLGWDPLAPSPKRIKPLPPAVGAAVFLVGIGVTIAFFTLGQTVFGPLATAKVNLLTAAVMSDDPAGINKALRAGVFIDVRDNQGATALLQATRAGSVRAAEALLQAKANPNLSDINDETPLMLAVNNKQNGLAVHLLDAGADIQAVDANGRTPLYLAASRGNSEMVRRLLKEGADANQADAHGWTPLIAAAASEDPATVQVLLDAGANPGYTLPDGRRAVDLVSANEDLMELLDISQKPAVPLPAKE